ncbi:sigma factor [Aquibium sp. ELW1220]|uniref:RNA polymerase sigma factor n=1 Tax=Aquibium sp. ELW1220 TaxID=2976766 RepID=UPI0025B24096|nr:sigma factor [Aquibium sp. ELW1220]MDN2578910.1 hypothetical protein [Aquibium sp. ELW1220]
MKSGLDAVGEISPGSDKVFQEISSRPKPCSAGLSCCAAPVTRPSTEPLGEISRWPDVPAFEAGHHSQGEIMKSCNRYDGINPYLLSQVRYRARRLSRHSLMQGMEIEDIEQELMLDILARTQSYDPDRAKWSTFVDRVLSNKCATMISTELAAKRGAGVRAISLDALRAEPDGDLHEPVDEASIDRTHLDIRIDLGRHIAGLPPCLSRLLRSLCERTMTEIARDNGVPKATLYGHLAVLRGPLAPLQEYLH